MPELHPEKAQEQLDELRRDIDEQRDELPEHDDEPRFIDEGGQEGPVDDTIAPPG